MRLKTSELFFISNNSNAQVTCMVIKQYEKKKQNSAESGVAPAPGWGGGGTGASSTSAMGKVLV